MHDIVKKLQNSTKVIRDIKTIINENCLNCRCANQCSYNTKNCEELKLDLIKKIME